MKADWDGLQTSVTVFFNHLDKFSSAFPEFCLEGNFVHKSQIWNNKFFMLH